MILSTQEKTRMEKRLYSRYKAKAKKRSKTFSLKICDFTHITTCKCAYCGNLPSNKLSYSGMEYAYNGIDRKDSSVGYEMGNVVACCSFCNSVKGSMKFETWIGFLRGVVETNAPLKYKDFEDYKRANKSFYRNK